MSFGDYVMQGSEIVQIKPKAIVGAAKDPRAFGMGLVFIAIAGVAAALGSWNPPGIILMPIVALGGRSARKYSGARGVLGLRIAGWVTFGICLSSAFAMIGIGAADEEVPPALIASAGVVGALAIVAFAVDALVSRKQVLTRYHTAHRKGWLSPVLYPIVNQEGKSGLMTGIIGRF